MSNDTAIVLLSGGIDSATCLYLAKKNGFKCFCLIFDYGQRHKREILAAKRIARAANCPWQILKINLPWKGSSILDRNIEIEGDTKSGSHKVTSVTRSQSHKVTSVIPATYVPGRNIIFLSFALSFAEAAGASAIYIGAHTQDYSGYPDCRPEFFRAFSKAASCGTKAGIEKREISIRVPLINKSKASNIRLGKRLNVPFQLTWSCYRGGVTPCGECDSCYFRAKGFKEAGIKDPIIKK